MLWEVFVEFDGDLASDWLKPESSTPGRPRTEASRGRLGSGVGLSAAQYHLYVICRDSFVGKSAGLVIERLRVRIPAGEAGEFSSPELTLCADSYSVSFTPPCYRSGT